MHIGPYGAERISGLGHDVPGPAHNGTEVEEPTGKRKHGCPRRRTAYESQKPVLLAEHLPPHPTPQAQGAQQAQERAPPTLPGLSCSMVIGEGHLLLPEAGVHTGLPHRLHDSAWVCCSLWEQYRHGTVQEVTTQAVCPPYHRANGSPECHYLFGTVHPLNFEHKACHGVVPPPSSARSCSMRCRILRLFQSCAPITRPITTRPCLSSR